MPRRVQESVFIRKSEMRDIEEILNIFKSARQFMRTNNNFNQWNDDYPGEKDIITDIQNGNGYVGVDSTGEMVMTFALIIGEDPTYKIIKEGHWLNEDPYATIHRIASGKPYNQSHNDQSAYSSYSGNFSA